MVPQGVDPQLAYQCSHVRCFVREVTIYNANAYGRGTPIMYSMALLPDKPDAPIDDSVNSFEVIERHKAHAERRRERMLRLFCADAHRQYIGDRQLVAGHKCGSKCRLLNLPFSTFSVDTDRIHVCIGQASCQAPANFHHRRVDDYDRVLFVCHETGALHICTSDACDALRIDKDTFSCCSLTGNVHSTSDRLLSHGWIEDDWRRGVSFKTCDAPQPRKANILAQVCREGNDNSNGDELQAALVGLAVSYAIVFMPGSSERIAVDLRIRCGHTIRFLDATEKYIRNCIESDAQVSVPMIHSIFRTATERSHFRRLHEELHMDEWQRTCIARYYATSIIQFLCTLAKHSCFQSSEYKFRDLVSSLLYMQKRNFTIHGTNLIIEVKPLS